MMNFISWEEFQKERSDLVLSELYSKKIYMVGQYFLIYRVSVGYFQEIVIHEDIFSNKNNKSCRVQNNDNDMISVLHSSPK